MGDERMTIQSLRYIVAVAEAGSITEAAKKLHISQPSLSAAVKEAEREVGFNIFTRSRSGIALTKEGVEFLGYARQVIQEMRLLEDRFILNQPEKQRFCVSTQHYTFTANAFVEMVQEFGRERFEFILNETQTHQILEDVKNRFCDLGILAAPHAFLRAEHPLAGRASVTLKDLQPYPRLNFLQGNYESADFSEEPFSTVFAEKEIRVSDRAAIVNLMIGLDGYTISTGIFPEYLQGRQIISVPLAEQETMHISYVLCKEQGLSALGRIYVNALKKYARG